MKKLLFLLMLCFGGIKAGDLVPYNDAVKDYSDGVRRGPREGDEQLCIEAAALGTGDESLLAGIAHFKDGKIVFAGDIHDDDLASRMQRVNKYFSKKGGKGQAWLKTLWQARSQGHALSEELLAALYAQGILKTVWMPIKVYEVGDTIDDGSVASTEYAYSSSSGEDSDGLTNLPAGNPISSDNGDRQGVSFGIDVNDEHPSRMACDGERVIPTSDENGNFKFGGFAFDEELLCAFNAGNFAQVSCVLQKYIAHEPHGAVLPKAVKSFLDKALDVRIDDPELFRPLADLPLWKDLRGDGISVSDDVRDAWKALEPFQRFARFLRDDLGMTQGFGDALPELDDASRAVLKKQVSTILQNVKNLEEALPIDSDLMMYVWPQLFSIGTYCASMNMYDEAEKLLALPVAQESMRARARLASVLFEQGKRTEAVEQFTAFLAQCDENNPAHMRRVQSVADDLYLLYCAEGKALRPDAHGDDDARVLLEWSAKAGFTNALLLLGQVLHQEGKFDEACVYIDGMDESHFKHFLQAQNMLVRPDRTPEQKCDALKIFDELVADENAGLIRVSSEVYLCIEELSNGELDKAVSHMLRIEQRVQDIPPYHVCPLQDATQAKKLIERLHDGHSLSKEERYLIARVCEHASDLTEEDKRQAKICLEELVKERYPYAINWLLRQEEPVLNMSALHATCDVICGRVPGCSEYLIARAEQVVRSTDPSDLEGVIGDVFDESVGRIIIEAADRLELESRKSLRAAFKKRKAQEEFSFEVFKQLIEKNKFSDVASLALKLHVASSGEDPLLAKIEEELFKKHFLFGYHKGEAMGEWSVVVWGPKSWPVLMHACETGVFTHVNACLEQKDKNVACYIVNHWLNTWPEDAMCSRLVRMTVGKKWGNGWEDDIDESMVHEAVKRACGHGELISSVDAARLMAIDDILTGGGSSKASTSAS